MSVELVGVSKAFGQALVCSNLHLRVEAGELVSLLGPSGCGKTTLLRMMCGLETVDHGERLIDNEPLANGTLDPRISLLFQQPVLYPHLTVSGNMALGLPNNIGKKERKARVEAMLEFVGMTGFGSRRTQRLSGGEAQRVAFGRALLGSPQVLLLDEPFSSVDATTRLELATATREWLKNSNVTAVHVTHDPEEAKRFADRLVNWNDLAAPKQEAMPGEEE